MDNKKSVVILGGGIGGLSAAHSLSKYSDHYNIRIYERNQTVGGLARSNRDQDGCATEYCWRVFFNFYRNLFAIFKDVPLIEDQSKTIMDNLTIYRHRSYQDSPISFKDHFQGGYSFLYGMTSSDRRLADLDNLAWWKAMESSSQSNLYREVGAWLGMDRYKGSYQSVIKVGVEKNFNHFTGEMGLGPRAPDYVTNQPTSEAIFKHWSKHLENQGVKIELNHQISAVNVSENQIKSVIINGQEIFADYFIFALPIEILSKLVEENSLLQTGNLINAPKLRDIALHKQLAFQVYFDRPISLGKKNIPGFEWDNKNQSEVNAFLLIDSPWDLIILQYDRIYSDCELCTDLQNAKGGWSVAACTSYIPGVLYNKPFEECTYQEIIDELWAQIQNSPTLKKEIEIYNGFKLDKSMIIKWSPMWSSYKFDQKTGKLETYEPKFTNNVGTYALRPSFKTDFKNLFLSTGYIKETIDIFSMEAAALAGKLAGLEIVNLDFPNDKIKNRRKIAIDYQQDRPIITAPLRAVDTVVYSAGGPNLGPLLTVLVALAIIIFIIYILYYIIKAGTKTKIPIIN